jgi:hypothetical protein
VSDGGDSGDIGDGDHDPFEGLVLNESFIAGAERREETAEERLARLRRIDEQHQALAQEREAHRRAVAKAEKRSQRRRRLRGGGQWRTIFVVIAAIGLAVFAVPRWLSSSGNKVSTESFGGFGTGDSGFTLHELDADQYPPPDAGASEQPLGAPPNAPLGDGGYAWLVENTDGTPARFDPCRVIRVVVNERTMPTGGRAVLQRAIGQVTAATGLSISLDGTTDEAPMEDRPGYLPDRYGETWAPVLVAWTDDSETPRLGGGVAGIGGPIVVRAPDGTLVAVSGQVRLDGPDFAEILAPIDDPDPAIEAFSVDLGADIAAGIIAHELGHLVGLDHVSDAGQLMHPQGNPEITAFQDGDRRGLAQLGAGPCHPEL